LKKLYLITMLTVAAAPAAAHAGNAADWSGPYVGIIGSYDNSDITDSVLKIDGQTLLSRKASLDGGLYGLQAGYGKQLGRFYAGVETDWQFGNLDANKADPNVAGLNETYSTDQMGTLRGRVGFIWEQFMPYVTGGLAIKHGSIGANYGPISLSSSSWDLGYTVGGGLEFRPLAAWSLKIEALYSDFGTNTLATVGLGSHSVDLVSVEDTGTTVRAGVAYHFN
jgi:outer membrane immunogenic protein